MLFNDWLNSLAPVELFTRPVGRLDAESEQMRSLLLTATTTLHHLHHSLSKAIVLLGQGQPLTKLASLFRQAGSNRAGIGSCPPELAELLSYVALQSSITSRAECKRVMRYSAEHRTKLAIQAAEHPPLERMCGLFLAVFDATTEAEQDYHFLKADDEAGRADLLELLQGVLALSCFQKA
ncbi:hypothetical protein [Hymenobacter sp. BRD67]|uniref:hypothetical protein n=1 Tax=Hymenobacter sp. BRD67 TaxID=2675877 RepID=UPI0015654995|nr:hypothetical protein [Hymenobacter sp. BRD67]QKG54380.1 hypothetical protein GKZ67_19465 [Hymenobacter sp. BRD67]